MRKILLATFIIIIILCLFKSETIIIPKESIRFRVIASSDSEEDQNIKKEVVHNLSEEIKKINIVPKEIEMNREIIKNNIPLFEKTILNTLKKLNKESTYTIEYGMNYFPEKEYKGIIYEDGEYESLVITLGDGEGENFWCVLFPPLCLLEGTQESDKEIEYKSFIKEIIDKYF